MTPSAHRLNLRLALRCAAAALALAGALLHTAPAGAYDWPVKPFDRQHPVRGFFGDPRIGGHSHALHFGIDVSAPNGTPVYAIEGGTAFLDTHRSVSVLTANGGHLFSYWHVVPAVRNRQTVRRHQLLGTIEAPWAHVHLAELVHGRRANPLRPGGLSPYSDRTGPTVGRLTVEREGASLAGRRASGVVDLVVEASDETPLAVPAPWNSKPVAPALVRWRIVAGRGPLGPWHVAVDFTAWLPETAYGDVYARRTSQNHASTTGRYRFLLRRGLDTRDLSDGTYRVEILVSDTAGNAGRDVETIVVANGSRAGR